MIRFSRLLLAVALLAGSAHAGPRRELILARMAVSDLDLSTDSGAAAMLRRLKSTAKQLCDLPRSELFRNTEGLEWRCRREAMDQAVARLKAPKLTLAYAEWISAEPAVEPPGPPFR
jgi:UrcA family protein